MARKRKKKSHTPDEENSDQPLEQDSGRDELEQAILDEEHVIPPEDPHEPIAEASKQEALEHEELPELFATPDAYRERRPFAQRVLPVVIGIAVAILLLGGGVSVYVASQLLSAKGEAERVRVSFLSVRESVAQLDFRAALQEFPKGQESIRSLIARVDRFSYLTWIPLIGPRIEETQEALHILERTFVAGERLLDIVNDIGDVIFTRGDEPFELYMRSLSHDDKGRILEAVTQALPVIRGVHAQVRLAHIEQQQVDRDLLSGDLALALSQAQSGGAYLQSLLEPWLPLAEVLPSFLGYPYEKTYLILLQDTSEVRATGGFISHYGILKLRNGDITGLETDNVFNLDDRAQDQLFVAPPAPFARHFPRSLKKWFLRDSNWEPDFSQSARQAELFYRLEGGQERLDGVLAATPELVKTLLRFTGPIRVEGRDYTAENVMQQLEFEVREGHYRRGIEEGKRKEIFGTLVNRIGEELSSLPLTQWLNLYTAIETRLREKHILLYAHDPKIQEFARDRHWTGEIRDWSGDYLMVVDTTFATLKTENVMDKRIRYTMREDADGFLVARLDLTYTNRGTYTDVTTVYRDWFRVFVPDGSTLIAAEGIQSSDDPGSTGTLESSRKYGKLEFAGYITVKPRHTKVVSLEYRLPDALYRQVREEQYALLVQKQPGISNQRFDGQLIFKKPIKRFQPLGFFNVRRAQNTIDLFHDYRTDQAFMVTLEKD